MKTMLSSLFCASQLLFGSAVARMGSQPQAGGKAPNNMSAAVDFQTFDLDGQVHDLMWCGYNDEVILMHTNDGTIYRSRDRGMSWKRLQSLLAKQGLQIVDDDQDVS